jgi:phage host-nuclease inhibitor protein Gam
MFADDSTFYTSASTVDAIESNLVSDLSEISNWCKTNQMSLHLGKTKTMLLTTRQKRAHLEQTKLNITFLDKDIECVSTHKLLGVTLDENLTWKDHCNDTCSKIRKKIVPSSQTQTHPTFLCSFTIFQFFYSSAF